MPDRIPNNFVNFRKVASPAYLSSHAKEILSDKSVMQQFLNVEEKKIKDLSLSNITLSQNFPHIYCNP